MKQLIHLVIAAACCILTFETLAAEPIVANPISNNAETTTTTTTTVIPTPALENAETPKPVPPGRLWNLQDADIISIINEVSLETGKNFIIDPRVTGKISLVSSKPINPSEVYDIFLSILSLLGYSAVPSGDVIKIVPNMESGEYSTPVATRQSPGKGDEVVVRVIPLENVSASQVIPVLRPMLPQWSNVAAYTPGNVLILLGRASNLQRLLNVINSLDQAADNRIEVVHLRQASAGQMATVLSNLQNTGRASGDTPGVTIAADERSNSILLGGNRAARLRMRALIAQLDAPTSGAQDNTEVVYLRYLQAKTLAPVLGKIAQNMLNKDGSVKGTSDTPPSPPPNPSNIPQTNKNRLPENLTNIQAEPNTNALIITAPPSLMRALNAIIAKLDVRPSQVLVEAVFVEIDQSDLTNFGIQWGSQLPSNVTANLTGAAAGSGTIPSLGPGFPPLGAGIFGIIPNQDIRAVLSLLQNKSGVNILSTPSIVVLDNQRATLEIGKEVPQQTGSYATTGNTSTVNPFNTIANKPVTLKLDVVPQINLGNSVRLKITLKNDTLQNPDNPGLNPIINISKIQNSVIVNSCDILVLGGLVSNNLTDTTDKVPILGDIPVIGLAFQHKIRKVEKKNLMVFLKPIILNNSEQSNLLTESRYERTRQAQINWPEADIGRYGKQKLKNVLPLYKSDPNLPRPFGDV